MTKTLGNKKKTAMFNISYIKYGYGYGLKYIYLDWKVQNNICYLSIFGSNNAVTSANYILVDWNMKRNADK